MTTAEAEAYAAAKNITFRIGLIDSEFLPLTAEYLPGRITAEMNDGVVTDFSVE